VVVTGAAAGLGLAMAEVLAECGARVTLADIHEERLEAATAHLAERGCDVRAGVRRAGQLLQLGENAGRAQVIHIAAAGSLIQHGLYLIARGQGEVDQVGRGCNLPVAQPVESRFEIVREAGNVVEAEHRARTLDGM